jgi:hypothetical protein
MQTTTTTQAIRKSIKARKDRNRRFIQAPVDKRIVAACREALKQLADDRLQATTGVYFAAGNRHTPIEVPAKVCEEPLDKLLDDVAATGTSCMVCGIGAVFCAVVHLADNVTARALLDCDAATRGIHKEFAPQQLQQPLHLHFSGFAHYLCKYIPRSLLMAIENQFEARTCNDRQKRAAYGSRDTDTPGRLVRILKNIIKNKGKQFTTPAGVVLWKLRSK